MGERGVGMGTGRVPGDPDDEVRRWLAGRLDDDESTTEDTPTAPRRRPPAPAAARLLTEEADDDPETEVADGSLEDEPRTVRMSRLAVSAFLGESVADDETVQSEWSLPEGPVDEVPLAPRTPTPPPARRPRAAAVASRPPVPPAPSPPSVSAVSASSISSPPAPLSEPNPWLPVFLAVVTGAVIGLVGAGAVLWLAL